MSILKNITFVIITPEGRERFLNRCLDYYNHNEITNIIICDSSAKEFKFKNEKKFLSYNHLPNFNYFQKMNYAIKLVKTKYVIYAPDDDFLVINSIKKAFKIIENNKNLACVGGLNLEFDENSYKMTSSSFPNVIHLTKFINTSKEYDFINKLDFLKSFQYYFDKSRKSTVAHNLYNTEIKKNVLSHLIDESLSKHSYVDRVQIISTLLQGKVLLIPNLWILKSSYTKFLDSKKFKSTLDHTTPSTKLFDDIKNTKLFSHIDKKDKNLFMNILKKELHEKDEHNHTLIKRTNVFQLIKNLLFNMKFIYQISFRDIFVLSKFNISIDLILLDCLKEKDDILSKIKNDYSL